MRLIGVTGSAVGADVQGIGDHLGVIAEGEGNDGGGVRNTVNHLTVGVGREELEVPSIALIELQGEAVVSVFA
jgi:hypothetical protein